MKLINRRKIILSSAGIFLGIAGCATTGTTKTFYGTSKAPAAVARVKTFQTDNNNTQVDLKVKHLASPQRVAPNASTYVVWVKPLSGDPDTVQKVGALRVDKDLNAELSTILPNKNYSLFITAEMSSLVVKPAEDHIIEGSLTGLAE